MYKLKKNGLKWLKIVHLFAACCWIGGAMALTTLNLCQPQAKSQEMLHGMNHAAHLVDVWVIIIPGANGCLLTGLIYGLFTNWGFFKHRWMTMKWILTILAMLSGTFMLGVWEGEMLAMSGVTESRSLDDEAYLTIKGKHALFSFVQLSMLVFMVYLSVFKPWKKATDESKKISQNEQTTH